MKVYGSSGKVVQGSILAEVGGCAFPFLSMELGLDIFSNNTLIVKVTYLMVYRVIIKTTYLD